MSEIDPLGLFWAFAVALVIGIPFLAHALDGSFAPMLRGAVLGAVVFGGAGASIAGVFWVLGGLR